MPEVLQQMLNYMIAIYIRLSAEDGDLSDEKSESNSVVNQRAYIRRFIEPVSYTHLTLPTNREV